MQKIREAKRALQEKAEAAAREKREAWERREREAREEGVKGPARPSKIDPSPPPRAQRNFTDPESSILKGPEGFMQAYNGQAVVDGRSQGIVACDVTNSATDVGQVEPMMRQVRENPGRTPLRVSMDAGSYSRENVALLEGIETHGAAGRQGHAAGPPPDRRAGGYRSGYEKGSENRGKRGRLQVSTPQEVGVDQRGFEPPTSSLRTRRSPD